jgi:hypothetical protein
MAVMPTWGQQEVLIDTSGSMAGFAARGAQITGFIQRLGHTLEGSGPVKFDAFASQGGKPFLTRLDVNAAALRFSDKKNFRGNSPLTWALTEVVRRGASKIVILTDGMEDDARLGQLANALAGLATGKWAIGMAAFVVPFDGNYYTEMKIPFQELQPRIEKAIHAENSSFKVAPANCTASATATCYSYTGDRPLLAIVLGKDDSLNSLFSLIRAAALESVMPTPSEVILSPLSDYKPQVRADLPLESREWLRSPSIINGGESVFECVRASHTPLAVQLFVSAPASSAIAEPSLATANDVHLVGPKPNWAQSVSTKLTAQRDGSMRHDLLLVCIEPSLVDSLHGSTILPAALTLTYSFRRMQQAEGWWVTMSAPNSWEYPNKVYHLREVIDQVQGALLPNQTSLEMKITLKLRSRR